MTEWLVSPGCFINIAVDSLGCEFLVVDDQENFKNSQASKRVKSGFVCFMVGLVFFNQM